MPGDDFFEGFGRFLEFSRIFFTGVSPPGVRWEVSYKGKSFQKKLEIWSGAKLRKMPQIGQGGQKTCAQKGPGLKFGPMGPIVPCGSLGCLFPLGGNLGVSERAPLLENLRTIPMEECNLLASSDADHEK